MQPSHYRAVREDFMAGSSRRHLAANSIDPVLQRAGTQGSPWLAHRAAEAPAAVCTVVRAWAPGHLAMLHAPELCVGHSSTATLLSQQLTHFLRPLCMDSTPVASPKPHNRWFKVFVAAQDCRRDTSPAHTW